MLMRGPLGALARGLSGVAVSVYCSGSSGSVIAYHTSGSVGGAWEWVDVGRVCVYIYICLYIYIYIHVCIYIYTGSLIVSSFNLHVSISDILLSIIIGDPKIIVSSKMHAH